MMLADHGADVLKIERPEAGDDARRMPPFIEGESAPFLVWNRNKRSVELDLKSVEGKAKLLDLVDGADILIENMRPGVMDKLGLGYATLGKRNPRLIYAAISGFGQTGPYANRDGFDLIAQGMSGLISTNGPVDGPPYRLPIAISDVAAGMFLAFGIWLPPSRATSRDAGRWSKRRFWRRRSRSASTRPRTARRIGRGPTGSAKCTAAARRTNASRRLMAI